MNTYSNIIVTGDISKSSIGGYNSFDGVIKLGNWHKKQEHEFYSKFTDEELTLAILNHESIHVALHDTEDSHTSKVYDLLWHGKNNRDRWINTARECNFVI